MTEGKERKKTQFTKRKTSLAKSQKTLTNYDDYRKPHNRGFE